jgi:hypothetical protein
MTNSGYVDVVTKPAGAGSLSVPELGSFSALAGPTVVSDGTVLLGTEQGRVIALHADGSPYWDRELPGHAAITTSPVVGLDFSVYAVGLTSTRDHRGGSTVIRRRARVYRFGRDGTPLPDSTTRLPTVEEEGPVSVGQPAVYYHGSDVAIMLPAHYRTGTGTELHLLALAPSGGVMADWSVAHHIDQDVIGGWGDWGVGFTHGELATPAPVPLAGIAIRSDAHGGTPRIVLVDAFDRRIRSFYFCVGDQCAPQAPGFHEMTPTITASRDLFSAPMIGIDDHSVVGARDGVAFGGPAQNAPGPIAVGDKVVATSTMMMDGSVVVVTVGGEVVRLREHAIASRLPLTGITMARAATSRTHTFVATSNALYTLDTSAAASVLRFSWVGGGVWPPVIGPYGHVYAMASDILFVFPPPTRIPPRDGLADILRDVGPPR